MVDRGVISALKQSSFALSRQIGFMGAVARSEWRRRRVQILCYHGVALDDEHRWNPWLYVSAATFSRRLAILRRNHCDVLPLGEAVTRLHEGTLPDRAVVLTFDDGYFDFKGRALPLLEQHSYPATVYLTTLRSEHNFPIVQLFLSYVLWKRKAATLDGRGIPGLGGHHALTTAAQRDALVASFLRGAAAAGFGATEKDRAVRAVTERLGLDYQQLFDARILRLMTPGEVSATAGPLADFQLHTHAHHTPDSVDEFIEEIRENRRRIEAMTGRPANHFCYPSGVYRKAYLPALAREGVISATTCDPGIAGPASDALLLPRFVDTDDVSDLEFEAWVTGTACWLPRRTRKAYAAVH
jgi:peptidoglycan/xylan/chitin deacetylase (PgdA/CDA1 family)